MLSLDRNQILQFLYSSDQEALLIGHTDVLSRTKDHDEGVEVRMYVAIHGSQKQSLSLFAGRVLVRIQITTTFFTVDPLNRN